MRRLASEVLGGWARRWLARACVGALACGAALAAAQPAGVTVVVPFAPNGPTDRMLRAMLPPLSKALGEPVTVRNVASPGGVQGLVEVAQAAPDGRTLLFTHTNVALLPALGQALPIDPLKDLSFLGLVLEAPMVVLTRPSLQLGSARELGAWLSSGQPVRLADAGTGSASYLCGLFLQSMARKGFERQSFPGSAPAMTALKSNQADVLCDQTPSVRGPLGAQEVRAYAITASAPLDMAPFEGLPTLRHMFARTLELGIWHGFYAPKNLAPDLRARLNTAIRQAAQDPEFVASQRAQGVVMVRGNRLTPEGHLAFVQETIPLWQLVVSLARTGQF